MKNSLIMAVVVLGLPTLASADLVSALTGYYDPTMLTYNGSKIVHAANGGNFENGAMLQKYQSMNPKGTSYVFNATTIGEGADTLVQVSETKVFNQDKNSAGDAAYTTRVSSLYNDGSLRNSLLCVGHQNEIGSCAEATVRSCSAILKGYNEKIAAMKRNGAGDAAKKVQALKGQQLQDQVQTCANIMSVYGDALKNMNNLNASVKLQYDKMASADIQSYNNVNSAFEPASAGGFLDKLHSSKVMQAEPLNTGNLVDNDLSQSVDKFELMTKLVDFCRENRNRFDGSISDDGAVSGQKHAGAR